VNEGQRISAADVHSATADAVVAVVAAVSAVVAAVGADFFFCCGRKLKHEGMPAYTLTPKLETLVHF